MGSAANAGIITIMPKLLIVAAVVVVILFVLMYVVRRQDEIEETLKESQKTIIECRQKRYQLLKQARELFGNGNPDVEYIDYLIRAYELVFKDDMEIEWERSYILVMPRFMEYAQNHVPAQMQKSYEMAFNVLEENERTLSVARADYESAKKAAKAFLSPPLSYVGMIGDKTTELLRKHHENKTAKTTDEETR